MLAIYPTLPIIPLEFISMCQLVLLLPIEISNYIKGIPQPDEPVHQSICTSRVFAGRKCRPQVRETSTHAAFAALHELTERATSSPPSKMKLSIL